MAIDDKNTLRNRLESCVSYEAVLPALTEARAERAALRDFAALLRLREIENAESVSLRDAKRSLDDLAIESAVAEIAESGPLADQMADFAEAGFNLVRVSDEFREMSLADRRASGGAGSVTRVMRSDDTLLLETERINVRLRDNVMSPYVAESFAKKYGLIYAGKIGPGDTGRFIVRGDYATYKCLELLDDDDALFAEPDFVERIGQRHIPSEPEFGNQWHHDVIDAPTAWDTVTGDPVRVAFIDTGFHVGHADLNIDHQHSGWFRNSPGDDDADFVAGTNGMPTSGHGTACAAMIASPENGVGGIGVAYNASLRVVACLNDYYIGTQSTLARALAFAVDPSLEDGDLSSQAGADVIGCSLGPNDAAWQMRRVLEATLDDIASYGRNGLGTPVFWACTNGNYPIKHDEVCSHPEVIVVGRSTKSDSDDGSGYGPELDFLAPGVKVRLPKSGGAYGALTGTSFACPCAAGVAALMLARDASLTATDLRQRMRIACEQIGPLPYVNGRNDRFGSGRINALRSIP